MKEFFIPNTVTEFSNDNPFVLIAVLVKLKVKNTQYKCVVHY